MTKRTNKTAAVTANEVVADAVETPVTFTMPEIARALNIDPKIARSRYRNFDNDGVKTRYQFAMSQWDEVALIISPKRVKRVEAPAVVVPVGTDE